MACSHVDEVTPRSYVGMVLVDTKQQRVKIEQALSSNTKVLNSGILIVKAERNNVMLAPVDFGWITASGTIIIHNKKYGVVLIQEPKVSQNGVTWGCTVYPVEAKPNICN